MPDLEESIAEPYGDQVRVLALHPGESPEDLADFVAQTGLGLELLEDQGTIGLFDYNAGVGYRYPRDVVIDQDLVVRASENAFHAEEMRELIESLLAAE